jgi:hypothetical protein
MLRFLKTATEDGEHGRRLPAQRRSPGQLADHDAGPRQSRHTTVTSSAKSPAR